MSYSRCENLLAPAARQRRGKVCEDGRECAGKEYKAKKSTKCYGIHTPDEENRCICDECHYPDSLGRYCCTYGEEKTLAR